MKRKIVSLMLVLAMCGGLAAMAVPNGAQASANGCSSSHNRDERHRVDEYEYFNEMWHNHWGHIEYYCFDCGEMVTEYFDYRESHDMQWVDYNTGLLRCFDCGYEEYFN